MRTQTKEKVGLALSGTVTIGAVATGIFFFKDVTGPALHERYSACDSPTSFENESCLSKVDDAVHSDRTVAKIAGVVALAAGVASLSFASRRG